MSWISVLEAVASLATALGVGFVWWQIRTSKQQAITAFEDELVREYRQVIVGIPTKALLGAELSPSEQEEALDEFYRYIDLCNTQIFYWQKKRIRQETWENWQEGILTHFKRPAFEKAWKFVDEKVSATNEAERDFDELRQLLKEGPKSIEK